MFTLQIEPKPDSYYGIYLYVDNLKLLDSEVHLDESLSMQDCLEVIWNATKEPRNKIVSNYSLFATKNTDPRQVEDQLEHITG